MKIEKVTKYEIPASLSMKRSAIIAITAAAVIAGSSVMTGCEPIKDLFGIKPELALEGDVAYTESQLPDNKNGLENDQACMQEFDYGKSTETEINKDNKNDGTEPVITGDDQGSSDTEEEPPRFKGVISIDEVRP